MAFEMWSPLKSLVIKITVISVLLNEARAAPTVLYLKKMMLINERLTISGFDSGGDMASQMHVAFSKNFRGVAMFASIWYMCSPYGFMYYREKCGKGANKISNGINAARNNARNMLIDPLAGLADQKVYHWIPNRDELVDQAIRTQVKTFYEKVGVKPANIMLKYQFSYHIMPTANTADPLCRESQITKPDYPYSGVGTAYCTYYGAYEGLNYLIGNVELKKPVIGTTPAKLEPVRLFNQSVFLASADQDFLDPVGYYYIPSGCKGKPCRLHMFLHGCYLNRDRLQSQFVKRSGYLEVAELNNIIMLFPQSIYFDGNDLGCWDVFGSTGEEYAIKTGIQMTALAKMLETVTGKTFL
ncbi:unnamed protein product [Allacma fusca]|uniref:Uncharacterized protein n=1 Tax=Allacma fusca TaxID=39272 RepID=A0A8J2P0J8_9HEXA|nr:unnamed protein product [Allacma fusca]